jgi:hypothetical protein
LFFAAMSGKPGQFLLIRTDILHSCESCNRLGGLPGQQRIHALHQRFCMADPIWCTLAIAFVLRQCMRIYLINSLFHFSYFNVSIQCIHVVLLCRKEIRALSFGTERNREYVNSSMYGTWPVLISAREVLIFSSCAPIFTHFDLSSETSNEILSQVNLQTYSSGTTVGLDPL